MLVRGQHRALTQIDKSLLKVIWHCPNIIPRIRLFLWKLFHGAVPTGGVLSVRLPNIPSQCGICNNDDDTPVHALFTCPLARSFWLSTSLGLRTDHLPNDPRSILQCISVLLQGDQFVSFANSIWAFWKSRCAHLFDGKEFNYSNTHHMALSYDNLSLIKEKFHIPNALKKVWHGPQATSTGSQAAMIQCWIDGSFSPHTGMGGWSGVFKSTNGLITYAVSSGAVYTPFGTELNGLILALTVAQEENFTHCTFLMDSLQLCQVMNALQQPDALPWQDFHALKETVSIFRRNQGYGAMHIPRANNEEAHILANYARINSVTFREYMYPLVYLRS